MAGGSFRIAEGYVEVTADREAYDRTIDRLKGERNTVKVGLALDEGDFTARLDRLTRDRTLGVKLNVDESTLQRLRMTDISVGIKPNITDAELRRVQAALDKLTADRVVRIRADVDTRVGAAEIRNLIQRRTARIGVDVDTRVAAADLANLTRTRQVNVNANARTEAARLQLDRLARDRHMNIDVGVGGGGGISSASGGIGMLSSRIAQLAAVALGALPTMASLGESLIQMGPAAAVAAPAVLALGSAFAAIKLGTSGISDAFKAAFAPVTQGATAAASSTRAVENTQRALVKAEQNVKDVEQQVAAARVKAARDVADAQQALKDTVQQVADSNHQAAESVASAERDLTNAQKAATQAQKDLTQARKDAAMELEDLNNQLADSQLSQRQDVLNLADAERQLAADKAAGLDQNSEQYQKDQLARDQAAQALKEQQTQTERLQEQADAANKAGVEGSQKVVDAKQNIADANQEVIDKTQALQDAQTQADRAASDGAEKIAKATRDLADARQAQTQAAVDGARQIADANQAVTDAAQSLADAQNSGALAVNKTANALAVLSPQARAFVQAVIDQREAWKSLKLDVQDALFRGLGVTFTALSTAVLPSLRSGLSGTAGVLNTMAKNAAAAVINLAKAGTLKSLFAGLNAALQPLAKIPGQFITALTQLGVAAQPAFKRITDAVGRLGTEISQKLTASFQSGSLTTKISGALDIAKQFGKLLGDAFGILNNVMKAAAAGGGDALGVLGQLLAKLKEITGSPQVQKALTSIFTAINTVAKLLAGTLGDAIGQLVIGLAPVATAITQVLNSLGDTGPLIGGVIAAFNPFLGILTLIAPMIGGLAKPLVGLVKSVGPLLGMLSTFASGLLTALEPVLGALINVLSGLLQSIAPVFAKVAPVILQVVTAIAGPLAKVIQSLIPAIGPLVQILISMDLAMLPLAPQLIQLIPPIANLAVALTNLALSVLTPLVPLITGLASVLTDVLSSALTVLVPVINSLVVALTALVAATSVATKGIAQSFSWLWNQAKLLFSGLARDVSTIWSGMWSGLRTAWNNFWSGLSGGISTAWNWIKTQVSNLRSSITGTWSSMWTTIKTTFTSTVSTVSSRIASFASGTQTAFNNLKAGLSKTWDGIKAVFANPVRFVVNTVYNDGIRKMWDTIAGKVGLAQLPSIKLGFNIGGVVPGQGRGDIVPAMLTPGERILSLSQVAALGGHRAIDWMVGRSDKNRSGRYSAGGIISTVTGDIGGVISSGAGWVKHIVTGGLQAAAKEAIKAVVQPLINKIPTGGTAAGSLIKGIPTAILNGILATLGKKDKAAIDAGQIPYKAGAGVAQWAGVINQALMMLNQSPGWLGTVERRMNQESGGNPNIVNKWDSNWKAGTPSVGLMQVIGPTYRSNAGPFGQTGPFLYGTSVNPLANTYAGLRYAIHRYGSLSALNRPGGYDSGGLLMPGATMAVNKTGRPERVLNADHTAKLDALLANGSGGGGVTIEAIYINGTFDLTSTAGQRKAAQAMAREMNNALINYNNSIKRPGVGR